MFWLLRPPYVRWLAAAAVFATAAMFDVAASATEPFPFAAAPIAAGAPVAASVEWRDVPRGLLPGPAEVDGFAARALASGEPLTTGSTRTTGGIPAGWWSVPIVIPDTAAAGAAVRLVAPEAGLDVAGIVAQPATAGAFSTVTPGLVAVDPNVAAEVAAAAALGQIIVLLGS